MLQRSRRSKRLASLILAGAALLPAAALAQSWTSTHSKGTAGADKAGFSVGGTFDTLWFSCEDVAPGTVRLIVTGFDAGLQDNLDYSVVVTVDGTAFRQVTRRVANEMDGGSDLVRTAPMAELSGLIAALKDGSSAEIASPAGRWRVPLAGSGKALAALEAGCR